MARDHGYSLRVVWSGAQDGPARDYKGYSRAYRIEIAGKPVLMGSADAAFLGDPSLHNPEDLLLAALSGCHLLTYLALCVRAGIQVISYQDDATGTMVLEGGGGRFTEVTLRPRVVIAAEEDLDRARALHPKAHGDCFIANSVNFPVRHHAEVIAEPGAGSPRGRPIPERSRKGRP